MKNFEIYWDDLKEETQKELFDFLGGENGNYDVFPIITLYEDDVDDMIDVTES